MKRLLYLVPAATFVVLGILFWQVLILREHEAPNTLSSTLLGVAAPDIRMKALDAEAQGFTRADLGQGKPIIVNFWFSTCAGCIVEADVLNDLAKQSGVPIYGIDYGGEDTPAAAREFLKEHGNPFAKLDYDQDGHASIDWGVSAYPETFVIDGKGIIRVHYRLPLDADSIRTVILPALKP